MNWLIINNYGNSVLTREAVTINGLRGQALVEGLLVLPIVTTLFLGLVQLIWLLLAVTVFQQSAVLAVHAGAVTGLSQTVMQSEFQRRISVLPGRPMRPASFALQESKINEIKEVALREGSLFVLPTEHYIVGMNMGTQSDKEKLLAARTLYVDVSWCFPLRVPIVATMIAAAQSNAASEIRCNTLFNNQPTLKLQTTILAPLKSELTLSTNGVVESVASG